MNIHVDQKTADILLKPLQDIMRECLCFANLDI